MVHHFSRRPSWFRTLLRAYYSSSRKNTSNLRVITLSSYRSNLYESIIVIHARFQEAMVFKNYFPMVRHMCKQPPLLARLCTVSVLLFSWGGTPCPSSYSRTSPLDSRVYRDSKPAVNRQPGFRREDSLSLLPHPNLQGIILPWNFLKKRKFSKILKILKIYKFTKISRVLDISLSSSEWIAE